MINNLEDYFKPDQRFFLDKISYNRMESTSGTPARILNCIDQLDAFLNSNSVKLVLTRTLKFDPEAILQLSVSFGVVLTFKEELKSDLSWDELDLAKEFRQNGRFATDNLMRRICLLIAEITSSFGQPPIITPDAVAPLAE